MPATSEKTLELLKLIQIRTAKLIEYLESNPGSLTAAQVNDYNALAQEWRDARDELHRAESGGFQTEPPR